MSGLSSKNMFAVLHQDDSDDEPKKVPKEGKRQQRVVTKQQREQEPTAVHKTDDRAHKGGESKTYQDRKDKDTYSGEGKRTYDRHSGQGSGAFNKTEKRQGGGKGNWASKKTEEYEVKPEDQTGAKTEAKQDEPEEIVEPVVTLDDFMKEQGMKLETQDNSAHNVKAEGKCVMKGFAVHKKADKDYVECETKDKNLTNLYKFQPTNVETAEVKPQYGGYQQRERREGDSHRGGRGGRGDFRGGQQRGGHQGDHATRGGKRGKQLGEDDFPTLG